MQEEDAIISHLEPLFHRIGVATGTVLTIVASRLHARQLRMIVISQVFVHLEYALHRQFERMDLHAIVCLMEYAHLVFVLVFHQYHLVT